MSIAADLALALDPALILTRAGMPPDEWQARVLRRRPRRLLLNVTRQGGKSSTVGAMAIDEAVFHAPALVLVLSPSQRQSQEAFRVIMQVHQKLGLGTARPESESSLRVELENGSRIVALPGKEETVRGYAAVGLLIMDEAARVADDLYRAVRPMLAVSRGRMVALSTPFGKRGWWHKEWSEGEDWERVRVTAAECPRISAEFLAEEKRALPESWFRQEYCCEFADAEGSVFSYSDVMGAMSASVKPLFELPANGITGDVQPLF
jgi:hypothetical protein